MSERNLPVEVSCVGNPHVLRKVKKPSGLECPECGCQLLDDKTMLFGENPPQCLSFCRECGFQTTRFF